MTFNFENLKVYNLSLNFANTVFCQILNWPSIYQYSLADQLRRASLSIPLNIAEGSSRTKTEFKRFLSIARGSCFECIPLIEISYKQKLITLKEKENWLRKIINPKTSSCQKVKSLLNPPSPSILSTAQCSPPMPHSPLLTCPCSKLV